MDYLTLTRPKLPRNKYGRIATNNTYSGGVNIIEGSGSFTGSNGNNPGNTGGNNITTTIYESEWYNLQTRVTHGKKIVEENGSVVIDEVTGKPKTTPYTNYYTIIENFDKAKGLTNTDNYRFVLMRLRKGKGEGRRWRIPMLSSKFATNPAACRMDIPYEKTWWKITGSETLMWNEKDDFFKEVLPLSVNVLTKRFKNTRNRKMEFGCAIFKRGGKGASGWQRVSNIATITLYSASKQNVNYVRKDGTIVPIGDKIFVEANTPAN